MGMSGGNDLGLFSSLIGKVQLLFSFTVYGVITAGFGDLRSFHPL